MSSRVENLEEVHLQIPQGEIKGLRRQTIYGDDYFGFEGIPYGKPPIGELRFKAPQPANNWKDILDCTNSCIQPMQMSREGVAAGSEDCLYMNIYSKSIKEDAKLPVMVWIYGGGFSTGNCTRDKYGPDYFMQKQMILVTFNYRLSSLGFLCLEDPDLKVPGNAGLKDQILAIQWVKKNIANFGGDCNNITIFGESAGAASVHYLLCTERARGLIEKAICMSGSILNQWAFSDKVYEASIKLARLKGYRGPQNDKDVLKFLQTLPAEQLVDIEPLNKDAQIHGNLYAFVPTQEPYNSDNAVITKNRLYYLQNAWGNSIPLMLGGTSFEGLVMYPYLKKSPDLLASFVEKPQNYFPNDVPILKDCEEFNTRVDQVLLTFFGSTELQCRNIIEYLDFFSYCYFWHSFHRLLTARQCYATAPTYQYCFDFDSPTFNHHRRMFCGTDITKGVAHADDVDYLFYSQHSWPLELNSAEYLTIQRMIEIWHTFAKHSNPNSSIIGQKSWKDVNNSNIFSWLNIGRSLKFERMSNETEKKFIALNNLYGTRLIAE